jgi:hypothetical protein
MLRESRFKRRRCVLPRPTKPVAHDWAGATRGPFLGARASLPAKRRAPAAFRDVYGSVKSVGSGALRLHGRQLRFAREHIESLRDSPASLSRIVCHDSHHIHSPLKQESSSIKCLRPAKALPKRSALPANVWGSPDVIGRFFSTLWQHREGREIRPQLRYGYVSVQTSSARGSRTWQCQSDSRILNSGEG